MADLEFPSPGGEGVDGAPKSYLANFPENSVQMKFGPRRGARPR